MSLSPFRLSRFQSCFAVLVVGLQVSGSMAQAPSGGSDATSEIVIPGAGSKTEHQSLTVQPKTTTLPTDQVRFSFDRVPWREVIRWLADECDLALQFDELPTGSFTYSDPSPFTHEQAIDRVNLFLLPQGYSLVRSGRLLSVINLGDPRSMQQLDSLAPLVMADQLDEQDDHDVVKCLFRLVELDAEEAIEELQPLQLMTTPSVFSRTRQLMITDTVTKLKNVRAILDSFQKETLDNGTVVKNFTLNHVEAEDILAVARPHLGLATGEMIGIDVSISADLQGKNIFVTGVEDKVKLIEGLIVSLDQPEAMRKGSGEDTVLQAHPVEGGNVETVYNVLQTLLAGESLRLSMDQEAGTIIALAEPDIQAEIAKTVTGLQASDATFEVIPLKTVDPIFAISLIEQMLDLDFSSDKNGAGVEPPKVDADPGNMRLFVRGQPQQIDQIKQIVAELDAGGTAAKGGMRMVPIRGQRAIGALESVSKFWREPNPIVLYPNPARVDRERTERVTSEDEATTFIATTSEGSVSPRILTDNIRSQAPMIQCQVTDRGLLLQSDDRKALTKLESSLQSIIGPTDLQASPPIVFYLAHAKANDAIQMLAELLDGGEAAREGEAGTLVNGYVSGSGSYLQSIVISREGMLTMMAGSMTVVADARLNRLIAQGTAMEIEKIEEYLRIIDKDSSLATIKTHGTSHVIELLHTDASEVADALRQAFVGRVAGATSGTAQTAGKAGQNPGRETEARSEKARDDGNDDRNKKSPKKTAAGGDAVSAEPKMTIAVHIPSNSLIVTAPDALLREVIALAQAIDQRSEQTIEVLTPSNAAIQAILPTVFGGGLAPSVSGNASRSRPGSSERSKSTPANRSAQTDRGRSKAIEAFREKFGR